MVNLYGFNDNYHQQNAHVLPMLLKRFHDAKVSNAESVTVWGSGKPLREFMFAGDLARAVIYLMENKTAKDIGEIINIGTGEEISISELADLIKETVGYKGKIIFDKTKPDGTMRKVMDISKINSLGFKAKTSLKEGIKKVYEDFCTKIDL